MVRYSPPEFISPGTAANVSSGHEVPNKSRAFEKTSLKGFTASIDKHINLLSSRLLSLSCLFFEFFFDFMKRLDFRALFRVLLRIG